MRSDHRLLASGAGWYRSGGGTWELAEGPTRSGYQSTGGKGRARCSCGVYSPVMNTREGRKLWFKRHRNENYPEVPYWEVRNEQLMEAVKRVERYDPSDTPEGVQVILTKDQLEIWKIVSARGVIRDMVSHYRRQRR